MKLITSTIAAALIAAPLYAANEVGDTHTFVASWYECCHTTANGEPYAPDGLTAAHRRLPFDTVLVLTRDDKTITVRVNDRGPYVDGRDIDLSRGAAKRLGCTDDGLCEVEAEILYLPDEE